MVRFTAIALLGLLFVSQPDRSGTQSHQSGTSVAGEMIQLDMSRKAALRKFSSCCTTTPLGDFDVIVQNKKAVSRELGGTIYFQNAKVSGIAADRDWTTEESSYETALTFYRLVDQMAHGEVAKATVYTASLEGRNGSSKYVVMEFQDGRSIRLEIDRPDPGADTSQQTIVSECVGNCADW